MAPLKPPVFENMPSSKIAISMNENSWLHWSIGLLIIFRCCQNISMNENSWLHWSISGISIFISFCSFPWMKIHGSIEAEQGNSRHSHRHNRFPWMKIHGSIEAISVTWTDVKPETSYFHEWKFMAPLKQCDRIFGRSTTVKISMNENSWLHWSWEQIGHGLAANLHFHEWKFMAPLKLKRAGITVDPITNFHEWKFMAPLKLNSCMPSNGITPQFPWMKIHGSIEAHQPSSVTT